MAWENLSVKEKEECINKNLIHYGEENGASGTYLVILPSGEKKIFITRKAISEYFNCELSVRMVEKILTLSGTYKPTHKKFKKFYGLEIKRIK